MYPINQKGFLPVDEVHVPHQSKGFPSYLIDQKETPPINKVPVPRQPEGNPSGQQGNVPLSLEEFASNQQGTSFSTGRKPFWSTREPFLLLNLAGRNPSQSWG
jgi:hypothetical protein